MAFELFPHRCKRSAIGKGGGEEVEERERKEEREKGRKRKKGREGERERKEGLEIPRLSLAHGNSSTAKAENRTAVKLTLLG